MTFPSRRIPLGPGGEFDLIRSLLGPEEDLPEAVLLGPGDDCAVLEGGWVVSADLAVEGVHFKREWVTLREAGFRTTAAALSDLAAMGAEPVGILLTLALDPASASEEAAALQAGAAEACELQGIPVLGGDLSRSPGPVIMDVVVLGRAGTPVLRAGTEAGDELWVTGWLGGSRGAVALWSRGSDPPAALKKAFSRPNPRIREALWLKERVPLHGLIDLSDGLAGDAGHLAAASGVGLVLSPASLPIHPALGAAADAEEERLLMALEGGEDFELCFTVPADTLDQWVEPFQDSFGIPLTRVGRAVPGEGVFMEVIDGELEPLKRGGFSHFPTGAEEEG